MSTDALVTIDGSVVDFFMRLIVDKCAGPLEAVALLCALHCEVYRLNFQKEEMSQSDFDKLADHVAHGIRTTLIAEKEAAEKEGRMQ